MKRLGLLIIPLIFMGCEASLGDKCSTSNECPSGMICDTDSPGGYCIVVNCEGDEECPENGTCVKFAKSMSYCLKKCKSNGDCRSRYVCRNDIGSHNFCYVAPEGAYGRDTSNRLDFVITDENTSNTKSPAGQPENPEE